MVKNSKSKISCRIPTAEFEMIKAMSNHYGILPGTLANMILSEGVKNLNRKFCTQDHTS